MKLWENKLLESYDFLVMVSYGIVKDKHGIGQGSRLQKAYKKKKMDTSQIFAQGT